MLYILVPLFSCNFHSYSILVFAFARVLVLVVSLFCILYVTNLALLLQDFNKLTYLVRLLPFDMRHVVSESTVPVSLRQHPYSLSTSNPSPLTPVTSSFLSLRQSVRLSIRQSRLKTHLFHKSSPP